MVDPFLLKTYENFNIQNLNSDRYVSDKYFESDHLLTSKKRRKQRILTFGQQSVMVSV